MSGPGALEIVQPFELIVLVDDLEGDGATQADALPTAAEDFDAIGLDSLPASPSISTLPATQLVIDRIRLELDAGWKAIDHGQERFAVRLSGSPISQHLGH